MIDVNVEIAGIVMYCDESLLGVNIGHGYSFEKTYMNDLPYKDKITDARGNLGIEYMGSKLTDEGGVYFICLKKNDIFQIEGPQLVPNKVMTICGPMCSEELEPYHRAEMEYLYKMFALLHVFQKGNIGFCDVFFDYTYKTLGIMNNNVHHSSHSQSRNIVDKRMFTLTEPKILECNQFLSDYLDAPFVMLKPCIDEYVWGIEQIDEPTGFEQYTTTLEMTLLEKDTPAKKQKLSNRVAVLLGSTPADIRQLHVDMQNYYRFRSESLHDGNGANISAMELQHLEEIGRRVLCKYLETCKDEIARDATITWATIKQTVIDDLIIRVTAEKAAGNLPT